MKNVAKNKVSASLESSTSPCDWSVGFKIPEGEKKARAEAVVMREKEAKVKNGNEVEIEKGKRAKVERGNEVEAKKGDEAAHEVEIEDSEAATEVPSM
ncbi:RNA-binding region (RNP1, RRM) containing 2, isoform CRA_b [Rattus norvegicus]|uniref:RNA-binding region (RNP1, RRM) containing 2, isoform CRA_b n=1 Tax=Rattus norvegicus TaxID=10116 RepID=A6KI97_RAT|nr:RNA-binding region (RNP1, RRM) containing 2, isoform CRA_b [Rattus norvegicus]